MKKELRKVRFDLNEQNLTIGDLGYEDPKGVRKVRHGYFHCWGDVVFYGFNEEKERLRRVAIVEESATGKIFEVAPRCITFEEPID
jgi:hypothetical protein